MQDISGASLIATHDPADATADPSHPRNSRTHLFALLAGAALTVLVLDQATKALALRALEPGRPVPVLGDAIQLSLIRNAGAAFSIATNATWVLTLIAIGVLAFICLTARRLGSRSWAWALGLLLGGSVGNLADRLLREPGPGRGHVVDFIDYFGWFIGNVADIAIVGAAALIAVLAWRGIGVDGARPQHGRREVDERA